MTQIKMPQIVGYNLLILLFYTICSGLLGYDTGEYAIYMMVAIALHVIVNILTAIVFFFMSRNDLGGSFLLSAGAVLVVGFSVCMGGATMF
ncbi:MAG: hypothetical protein DHS20C18_36390 [Saprospiraceae bacterium]|nr:MAG: hypothetical protein DHS20C18_36390 [Saprospiraceae bacterium]